MEMPLSIEQERTLAIVERVASSLSALGVVAIIATFCYSKQFRTPIHQLIFFNACFNIFDTTATMIGVSGPDSIDPNNPLGSSALCQAQGFLIQMFVLADVYWTLAIACHVFLVVIYKYDTADLRKMERKYIIVITALAAIPAVILLFIHSQGKQSVYGGDLVWCTISPRWTTLTIVLAYFPIWLTIFIVTTLFSIIGIKIFKQKRMLQNLARKNIALDTVSSNTASASNQSSTTTLTQKSTNRSPVSFRKYILMPLMFIVVSLVVWVAPTVNLIWALEVMQFRSYPLLVTTALTISLRGFWNGVIFLTIGMQERKRQRALDASRRQTSASRFEGV